VTGRPKVARIPLLAERGIEVDHVTIYRWVQRGHPVAIMRQMGASHPDAQGNGA
jgi:transposase-like protein